MKGWLSVRAMAALGLCAALSAVAADDAPAKARPGKGDLFKRSDSNQDGKLSLEEVKKGAPRFPEERFKSLDKDSDGFLSTAEMRAGADRKPGAGGAMGDRLRAADVDGDKAVSREEFAKAFPNAPKRAFDRMDTNKDGTLSKADRSAAGSGRTGRAGAGTGALRNLLKDADSDKDGSVSFEELTATKPGFPKEQFDQLDRNKDGKLNKADGGLEKKKKTRAPKRSDKSDQSNQSDKSEGKAE